MTIGMFVTGLAAACFVVLVVAVALCGAAASADRALGYKDEEDDRC